MLIALGAVFFFNYKNILLKDTGLIKYYKHSNDYLASIDADIAQSQQEIWFVGTDFNITAGESRNLLLKKLGAGVKVRFLIFDPKSSHVDDLARDFDQSPAELRAELDKGMDSITELQRRWQNEAHLVQSPGELEVKVFDTHPHARFYIFDPASTRGRTYFIPYVNGVDSPDVPGYLVQNVATGIFRPYFNAILKLWSSSESLAQHLGNPAPIH